ncbi:hypothetical protein ACFL0H_06665 [Thermodesulfobacteriota bacterium]
MQTRMDRGNTQTPCLGGLPGVGWLFKEISDRNEKKNLMLFLSPHIVENPDEARELYKRKREGIDAEVEKAIERQQPETIRKLGFE